MMLHPHGPKQLGHENLQRPRVLLNLHSPLKTSVFPDFARKSWVALGFNSLHHHNPSLTPRLTTDEGFSSHECSPTRIRSYSGSRVFVEFKPVRVSRTVASPAKTSTKRRYGGSLPSILRSLECEDDIEKALNFYKGKLNPKEQTVILKEQRSWDRVLRVFSWMKLQEDYAPNVIHYNVVLRSLGRALKWDELRLRWIEMARDGVLPTNNTYSMLVDVYGKAGLVKEAVLWIKHMRTRGIFPDEVTMNTVVGVLKDAGEFDRADRFYKNWCAGKVELEGLDLENLHGLESGSQLTPFSLKHFLSTELLKIGRRSPPSRVVVESEMETAVRKPQLAATYNTLIDLYGKAGRLNAAADVFAEMLKSGVAPDIFTFNTMIHTCGTYGHLSEAEALLDKMEERGISPDTKTYNTFLSLYAEAGNTDAALKCYWQIRKVGLFADVVSHRAVLHMLCRKQMVQEAESVIRKMEKSHIHVDEHSVPIVMAMYVNEDLLDKARIFLEQCQLDRRFSTKTYAAIIDVYAEKGLWTEAEDVFYGNKELEGQRKDVLEYNVMIKAYGKAKLYDKAFSFFKGMRDLGTWPDECTYNSLIQMFSGGDLVDRARHLLSEMQAAGLKPQCLTFSSVIASCARLGQVSDAIDVFRDMEKAEVKPNEVVYGSLINAFAEAGRIEDAVHYCRMMEDDGLIANQIILTSLIKAYSKGGQLEGAKEMYEKLKELDGGPDRVALNSMIKLYADLGMVSDANLIFDTMKEKRWADGFTYSYMMHLYINMGMLEKAINIAEEMKHSDSLVDSSSYTNVMACYAMNGQLDDCGELLQEMVASKILPDESTFKVLFTVLKKGGLASEAVKQLESAYQEGKPYARQAVITCVFSVVGLHASALESSAEFTESEADFDSAAYNVAIYAFGASGQTEKALNFLMRMQDKGLDMDLVTYINLVNCYGKANMIEGVKRVYSMLKYGEIEPNESLFKAVIDAYKNANRHDLAGLVSQEMKYALDRPQQLSDSETESDLEENG
ncbi:hypothetical protein Nepgr_000450 [Nepenthes gracilis]|uniref:PROP1-like PPR domain-containing protein n=1 Tax=Nepenthes gracilis TaxID=150966 RepID=A0AAD3RWG5_NEPGR|nr:hypothetical protein Nepgr_000450 [Nepenthes gracilis]